MDSFESEADVERLKKEKQRIEMQLAEATRTSQRTKKVLDTLMADSTSFHMSCRIRPFSDEEVYRKQYNILRADPVANTVELLEVRNDQALQVQFDEVFDSTNPHSEHYANQRVVYERVGKPLLDFALQGFNVTLIGFGQTASGKTYTLVGDNIDRGIVPRLITNLFEIVAEKQLSNPNQHWRIEMDALEVYNERIYNLLEGIETEDGYVGVVPKNIAIGAASGHRATSGRPSRFKQGTFADIEREQRGSMRPSVRRSTTPTSRASRPNGSRSTTPLRDGAVQPARGGYNSASSTQYSDHGSAAIRSISPATSRGRGSAISRSSSMGGTDLGAREEERYVVKGGVNVPFYISGLQSIVATDVNKVFNLLAITQTNKTIAETRLNRTSSRAHTLYRFHLTRSEQCGNSTKTVTSQIVLCDLAGSENIKLSNAQGVNMTEAISINKSLTVLAHCLSLRAANSKISPPYNTCTLTKLLRETLDGNARTHMVTMLAPNNGNVSATQAALRFAKMCKKVRTRPKCNLESDGSYSEHIQRTIETLRQQLSAEEGHNDALREKMGELEEYIAEEKLRAEWRQAGGPARLALRRFVSEKEKVLIEIEKAYFGEELQACVGGNGQPDRQRAREFYQRRAFENQAHQRPYAYRLEKLDPASEDDLEVFRSLSDIFQWSCSQAAAEFMLYRLQLTVTKIERVHNDRLRSDFYNCKAQLKNPENPSVLRFYGGALPDIQDTLRNGFRLPDPKAFNTYGVGLLFPTNAARAAMRVTSSSSSPSESGKEDGTSGGNGRKSPVSPLDGEAPMLSDTMSASTGQLLVSELALGSVLPPNVASQLGLHLLTPDLVTKRGYDSVHATCGPTLWDDEYVVFQEKQAIPAFVITYSIQQPDAETLRTAQEQIRTLEATKDALARRVAELERDLAQERISHRAAAAVAQASSSVNQPTAMGPPPPRKPTCEMGTDPYCNDPSPMFGDGIGMGSLSHPPRGLHEDRRSQSSTAISSGSNTPRGSGGSGMPTVAPHQLMMQYPQMPPPPTMSSVATDMDMDVLDPFAKTSRGRRKKSSNCIIS